MLPSLETPNQIDPSSEILEAAALLLVAIGASGRARFQTLLGRLSQLQQRKLRALGIDLGNADINTRRYVAEMTAEIEAEHTAAAAIFRGDLEDLTFDDSRVIRSRVNSELGFLSGLVIGWIGNTVTQGRLASRSQMYGAAVTGTFFATETESMRSEGFELYRNILHPADHCDGGGSCIEQTNRGLVPIGTLIPIGSRLCLSNCKCSLEYIKVDSEARVIL